MAGKIVKVQYMGKKEILELVVPNLSQIYTFEKGNDYTVKMDYDDAAYLLRAHPGVFKVVSGKIEEKDINPPPPQPEENKFYPSAKLIKMKQIELEAYAKEIGLKIPKGHPKAAIIKLVNEKASKKGDIDAAGDPVVDYIEPDGSLAKGPAV